MTEKQNIVCYYRALGYSVRQSALIAGVSDGYAARIINKVEEFDLDSVTPPFECVRRRHTLDYIIKSAGFVAVPRYEKYAYISLLGYLGFTHQQLKLLFPEDKPAFIYMALHRSDKKWMTLDPEFMGLEQEDYDDLMRIRRRKK